MPSFNNPIIHIKKFWRGTAGTTELKGATRARVTPGLRKKMSRSGGSELPDDVFVTSGEMLVEVEFEHKKFYFDSLLTIIGSGLKETLKLDYRDGDGVNSTTIKYGVLVDVGDCDFPPAEDQGNVQRFKATYQIVKGAGVETVAQAVTDSGAT